MNQRKAYLQYFFKAIQPLRYALLKFVHTSVDQIDESSDVDMVITQGETALFLDVIRKGPDIEKVTLHRKSFATYVSLYFADGSYLEIDLINQFNRKGIQYLNPQEVLDHSTLNANGLKLASHHHNFEYILLFYQLNHSAVPEKYRDYFTTFTFEERASIFTHITSRYKVNINVLDELYEIKTRFSKKIVAYVKRLPVNKGLFRLYHKAEYLKDLMRDLMYQRGITVTFSGVDGAGKSTIIEEVKETLQKKYRHRTVVLRHRPSLLPILSSFKHGKSAAEKKTREKLPRQGDNNSTVSSIFRFMYYYVDYVLGQYYIYFRYTLRGYTVLYDRYYFDFIIDAKRSNIVLPKPFMKWCYNFVFKPQVNVFLFAPVDVIRSRKNELSESDINSLTSEYKELFEELGKSGSRQHYLVINNTDLNKTLHIVMKECLSASA